jgi:hypothetical protein
MQNPVGHYAGHLGWTRSELPAFRGPDQMGGGDLIKGSGTPDWPSRGYPTFFGPWVVVTTGGQVKNVGLVMGRPEY